MMQQKSSTNMTQQTKHAVPDKSNVLVNFIAGGIGGSAGVFVTCPLDVVQTRFQSSYVYPAKVQAGGTLAVGDTSNIRSGRFGSHVFCYMKHVVKTEGLGGLYKGIVPNLIGIVPSRAIYFSVYSKSKAFLTTTSLSNSPLTHMLSALSASWSVSTITNPIWFLKTRLQLDFHSTGNRKSVIDIASHVYRTEGIRGFYRGLSASYMGASETMVYFVLYERLKLLLGENEKKLSSLDYVMAAFVAKFAATISVYPHEVARTRLRQESHKLGSERKYHGFLQTLKKVYKEENVRGLYGGMGAHLMRQVPNTVIMFLTYETLVNYLTT